MPKDTAKVGKHTVKKGPISTPYKDCAVAKPDQAGNWASVRNGAEVHGGAKGTGGEMDEVTLVDMHRAPSSPPKRTKGYTMSPGGGS
jgi:hypothetical protein